MTLGKILRAYVKRNLTHILTKKEELPTLKYPGLHSPNNEKERFTESEPDTRTANAVKNNIQIIAANEQLSTAKRTTGHWYNLYVLANTCKDIFMSNFKDTLEHSLARCERKSITWHLSNKLSSVVRLDTFSRVPTKNLGPPKDSKSQ